MNDRFEKKRMRLVEEIQAKGIDDPEVLGAVAAVPRHRFVPEPMRRRAYRDGALPIGYGQTISQPSLQALYLQTLEIGREDTVLEIGAGSGYQTALLAELAGNVYAVERIPELTQRAREILDELGYRNIALVTKDGTVGWSKYAPYDAILVGAASPRVPETLVDQLKVGGRLLIPVGDRNTQDLTLVTKQEDGDTTEERVTGVVFVPLIGRFGWPE